MNINDVLRNIEELIGTEFDCDSIIIAFEDYEYAGETYVNVNRSQNSGYDYIAYIDHPNSPQILILTDTNNIIEDVWIA